jgi:FkbM family methyltransferase
LAQWESHVVPVPGRQGGRQGVADGTPSGGDHIDQTWAKKEFGLLHYRLQGLTPESRARLQSDFVQTLIRDTLTVETPAGPLQFVLVGKMAGGRARSLLTKQTATIAWIDAFVPDSVFWDVGANIGTYALYAALRAQTRVFAFEPAAVNYFLLSANCEASKLDDRVTCLLLGIGAGRAVANLEVSQFEAAHSFSFAGKEGQEHRGRQASIILSIDELINDYGLACPNYLKVDAPGSIEQIFAGAACTLKRPELRELHIEVRTQSKAGQRLLELLRKNGFVASEQFVHGGSADTTFIRR